MNSLKSQNEESEKLKKELFRYIVYWPVFLISTIFFVLLGILYLRYTDKSYTTFAKIEVIDKAQDSEMALPTAMTIFNRSMINLENEIGVLNSYSLHKRVVKKLNSNISFFKSGVINSKEVHKDDFFDSYEFNLKIEAESINKVTQFYINIIDNNKLEIIKDDSEKLESHLFNSLDTNLESHDLPFELAVYDTSFDVNERVISFKPFDKTVSYFKGKVNVEQVGTESDQLNVSITYPVNKIAQEYINTLINEFDIDGIVDRQDEYKRTISFVDSRSEFLSKELEKIEIDKRNFKQRNNLLNIEYDASENISQQFLYDSELFQAKSQLDLLSLVEESISENSFELMPMNVGLDNVAVNELITQYNLNVKELDKYLLNSGENNVFVKNLKKQIIDLSNNILLSISNYQKSLSVKIENLEKKEREFQDIYRDLPENEKILRSIERELEVKESLFLLLLQKREEASINFAVIKPSIKIVDLARTNLKTYYPNPLNVLALSIFLGLFIPFTYIFLIFFFDSKIHTRKNLEELLPNIPIIGEVPFLENDKIKLDIYNDQRSVLSESIRMVLANFKFLIQDPKKDITSKDNILLVTSSVKGEGKTLVSVNISKSLSLEHNKVILIGSDLRNPQLHKFFNKKKEDLVGLSDYIYRNDLLKSEIIEKINESLDIIYSGTIPPNPNELLSSSKFESLINELKADYDYIIIDSAPCLPVSDTFEISKYANNTIYITRSNYTDSSLTDFIKECDSSHKLPKISLVLNCVGSSAKYGYKYGYHYGYKYNYSYNYGYGYGYSEDK